VEASALQAPAAISRTRVSIGAPLLRLRSDAQLVALFRAGHDDAFRIIHDRYRQRLFAYTRQMLPRRQDAEDALQDVFVRAYSGLRASDRELALRAWLYRVAHNRCVDELRRPAPPSPEVLELVRPPEQDPIAEADKRESLRRLIADVRRLPDQQRSALLMRELGGMSYAELAVALGVSIPAVKSLLVRARVALAQALEARDMACSEIQEQLSLARDRGVRPCGTAKRHMRDCDGCRQFHRELRCVRRRFAAITPAAGPLGIVGKVLGLGGLGGGASSYAAAGGGAAAAGGAAGTGAISTGALGASHVATLIAAAIVTAGGAVEIQHTIAPAPVQHRHHHHALVRRPAPRPATTPASEEATVYSGLISAAPAAAATVSTAVASTPAPAQAQTPNAPAAKPLVPHSDSDVPLTLPPKPSSEPSALKNANGTTGNASAPGTTAPGIDGTTGTTTAGTNPASCATGSNAGGTSGSGTATGTGTSTATATATGTPTGTITCAGTGSTSTSAPSTGSTSQGSPSTSAPTVQTTSPGGSGSTGAPAGSGSSPTGT
jgi:RNA polymerase sigma factor (sigma-70 family)